MEYRVVTKQEIKEYSDLEHKKFETAREFFDDCPHVGSKENGGQNISTPMKLCNEILDQVPEDLNGKTVLVLFNPEFYLTVRARWPDARITFITGSKKMAGIKLKGMEKIIEMDPHGDLKKLGALGMQFDFVVGNPPYQAPDGKSASKKQLWCEFIQKSLKLTKVGGHIAMIHPSSWRKPEHKLYEEFQKRKLKYLEIHNIKDGQHTFNASTRYDWYILENTIGCCNTKIKDEDGNIITENIKKIPYIPNSNFDLFKNVLARDTDAKLQVIYDRVSYGKDKLWIRKAEDCNFKYPCIAGMSKQNPIQLYYSNTNTNGHFGISKVIVNITGSTLCSYNDYDGKYGICQWAFGIKIDSKEDGENIIKAINSNEFDKIWKATQWLSMTREWRIFKYFKKDFWKGFV